MCSKLFEQSFLNDSLYLTARLEKEEKTVSNDVRVVLHDAGVFEIIPSEVSDETPHLLVTCCASAKNASHLSFIDSLLDDVISGFQKVKIHCLFILNEISDGLPVTLDDALQNYVKAFWSGINPQKGLYLDITINDRSSIYPTVAYSPKVRAPVRSSRLFEFFELSHIDAVVLHNAPTQTLTWNIANQFEVDSAQIELSVKAAEISQRRNQGFELTLRDFMAQEKSEHIPKAPKYFRVTRTIVKQHNEFRFLFSSELPNFTRFKHGEVFGMDGEKPLMAKNDGEAVLFPDSTVSVGDIAAIMVFDVLPRYEESQLIYD
ncbi:succinylglutamate desuccinylase/aspartoacylase domain-containing protein [Vibrio salinus]|uniref:succinylglutamate desuccinylase/aspartoacylase domain-containing protein n=1 Tax=Vibrio salinus TaxID=2899784 RepID=UPI001E2EB25C|nr:succinylglutamate desuccinylase/aspartoacylase family protein [Vibrio salinus]MCE0496304.1 succinylglutamate desuccinylase/aspartoacylase family protein [Vibrio salinus]